jgi:hypothetical protein
MPKAVIKAEATTNENNTNELINLLSISALTPRKQHRPCHPVRLAIGADVRSAAQFA